MDKIYNFLALMLLFVAGSFSAFAAEERDWTVWEISENQIEAPEDGMYVILQQGNNVSLLNKLFLNISGEYVDSYNCPYGNYHENHEGFKGCDATCIYKLIKVDTKTDDDNDVYVLQNVSNKQYLCKHNENTGGNYTYSLSEAFQCTIKKADASSKDPRSTIYGGTRQPDADGVNWVFCDKNLSKDGDIYLSYFGCPAFSSYLQSNDWRVYKAIPHAASTDIKLWTIYNKVFKNGFPSLEFTVGTEPGCISQRLYDILEASYNAANAALGNSAYSDKTKESIVSALVDIQDNLNNGGRITLQPGKFYMFISQRTQDAVYDFNNTLMCTKGKSTINDHITKDDDVYVWGVEDAGDGKYYIYNYHTGRYAGSQDAGSTAFPTTEKPSTKCIVKFNPNGDVSGLMFNITDNSGNIWHCEQTYRVVRWQHPNMSASLFAIKEVTAETIDKIKKARLMEQFNEKISEAKIISQRNRGVTLDDKYENPGLVTSFEACNATDLYEGKESFAFDGDVNTYYHTTWHYPIYFDSIVR